MKSFFAVVCVCVIMLSLSGCATGRKAAELETQGLRNQIQALESQLEVKDQEISSLRDLVAKGQQESEDSGRRSSRKKVIFEAKDRPSARQIQTALKNAGYNPGVVDGKMGNQTRVALRAFQKDNNLHVNGKADKNTWEMLKKYLYEKVK